MAGDDNWRLYDARNKKQVSSLSLKGAKNYLAQIAPEDQVHWFAWAPGMKSWMRIKDCTAFNTDGPESPMDSKVSDALKMLKESETKKNEDLPEVEKSNFASKAIFGITILALLIGWKWVQSGRFVAAMNECMMKYEPTIYTVEGEVQTKELMNQISKVFGNKSSRFRTVDCKRDEDLCKKKHIKSFPTVQFEKGPSANRSLPFEDPSKFGFYTDCVPNKKRLKVYSSH